MYIQLEIARLNHCFDYKITLDKNIDAEFLNIPPLIIQPLVENAIWHGLINKKENGFVKIEITEVKDSVLSIKITDNGIGRKASAELKKEQVKHKSYGIDIKRERIKILSMNNDIIITDLYDENGNPQETFVELKIIL